MGNLNLPEAITKICAETHVTMVQNEFGDRGLNSLFQIMNTAKAFYQQVDPERISGKLIIFQVVANPIQPSPREMPADFRAIANQPITDLVLELATDGAPYLRKASDISPEELAKTCVVYRWESGNDEFLAGANRKSVLKLVSAARSQFCVPTFSNLREALQRYAVENVRESTCYTFRRAWHDANRLFFRAKPEKEMRDSLTQFLRNSMGGDHDVWPEQNVNEKNPVDIRVQPRFNSNRLMIVEIKWLGLSVGADGHVTGRHKELRAQEGANQLAEYLDEQLRSAPSRVIQAYYVIIDGRRENLVAGNIEISKVDGLHYEAKEIAFNPDHTSRPDFDPPYRMFARPVCSG